MTFKYAGLPVAMKLAAAVLLSALAAAACDRPSSSVDTRPSATTPAPAAQIADRSESSGVPAAREGAKAGEGANANAEPMKAMTRDEESTTMPQPAQANDHSTLAKDSNK